MTKVVVTVLLLGLSLVSEVAKSCQIGSRCEAQGVLIFYKSFSIVTATLEESQEKCVALALPEISIIDWKFWDGKAVGLSGTAHPHISFDELVYYEIEGRNVNSRCASTPYSIFVDEIWRVD